MDFDVDITLASAVLALHVFAAAVWLGTVLGIEVFGARVRARGDAAEIVRFVTDAGSVGRRHALTAALAVLLAGGWLMQDGGYRLSEQWWLGAGIGLWLVAFLGSTMVRGPQAARMARLAEEHGAEAEDVQWRARRVLLLGRGEFLLVAVALVLMVVKPG